MFYCTYNTCSPIGILKLVVEANNLIAILWNNQEMGCYQSAIKVKPEENTILLKTTQQLTDYFSGKKINFKLPLITHGTDFQKKVWLALLTIPYGKTASYLDIAKAIHNAKAVRAVGTAIGHNPLSIVIPCHRVIGTNGKLTGFTGGLDKKEFLLKLEGIAV